MLSLTFHFNFPEDISAPCMPRGWSRAGRQVPTLFKGHLHPAHQEHTSPSRLPAQLLAWHFPGRYRKRSQAV